MQRRFGVRGILVLGTSALLLVSCARGFVQTFGPAQSAYAVATSSAALTDTPNTERLTDLGQLSYRGGAILTSNDPHFGGISGLLISKDGTRFLGVTDTGRWVTGELIYEDGQLLGTKDIELAPMLSPKGFPLGSKLKADSESLIGEFDIGPNGFRALTPLLVSFEIDHRIVEYAKGEDGFLTRGHELELSENFTDVKANKGLEAIVRLADAANSLLTITEYTLDKNGNIKGWLHRGAIAHEISLRPRPPYMLTDMALLPDGDVLTLERRFSVLGGIGMQMRRIPGADIQPGALLDGPIIATAAAPFPIDNMEGLDVRVNDTGEILVYMISDNNFNKLQRTLILMFALKDE